MSFAGAAAAAAAAVDGQRQAYLVARLSALESRSRACVHERAALFRLLRLDIGLGRGMTD